MIPLNYNNYKPDFLIYARINHSGYGMLKSTNRKISELMEIAALITSLVYHRK